MSNKGNAGMAAWFRAIVAVAFGGLVLAACAHPMRPMGREHTIVISGRVTAGEDGRAASRTLLVTAARLTLDHGFRYFRLVGVDPASVRPGSDVTIEVYRQGEIDAGRPGVWDAVTVGAGHRPGS